METIKATPINDRLFDFALEIADPMSPGSARIAGVLIKDDADMLVQAVNSYDKHVALLEQAQLALANIDMRTAHSLPLDVAAPLVALQKQVNEALVAHHEWLEKQ